MKKSNVKTAVILSLYGVALYGVTLCNVAFWID
jgi:hypothetical protein